MVGLLGWQGGWIATRVGRIDPDGTQLIYIYTYYCELLYSE